MFKYNRNLYVDENLFKVLKVLFVTFLLMACSTSPIEYKRQFKKFLGSLNFYLAIITYKLKFLYQPYSLVCGVMKGRIHLSYFIGGLLSMILIILPSKTEGN